MLKVFLPEFNTLLILADLIFFSHFSQALSEGEPSGGGAELHSSHRSPGLTAQLQALRKALYHKYVQEVTALKEQHSLELRRLREEKEQEKRREEHQEDGREKAQDLNGIDGAGSFAVSLRAAGPVLVQEKQNWERVEEEVAKVRGDIVSAFIQQQFSWTDVKRCSSFLGR